MADEQMPPAGDYRVNFFRPRPGFMRRKVALIWLMLAGWAGFTFGFQWLLRLLQRDPAGAGPLTDATFLGFPFHYWFTGQFLIFWFILLCLIFNLAVDRLTENFRKRR
jgi:putative solute:sodium symporter small subunit